MILIHIGVFLYHQLMSLVRLLVSIFTSRFDS
jgi:hypothetical protein